MELSWVGVPPNEKYHMRAQITRQFLDLVQRSIRGLHSKGVEKALFSLQEAVQGVWWAQYHQWVFAFSSALPNDIQQRESQFN
jgi:hypothetical protein